METTVPVRSIWIAAAYATGGLVFGFLFLPLIPVVRALGLPRDSSVGMALFLLMPLLLVVLGVLRPRLLLNLLGLLFAILTWGLGYGLACLIMGFDLGSIGFGLGIMAPFMVPAYFILVLLVFGLARRRAARK